MVFTNNTTRYFDNTNSDGKMIHTEQKFKNQKIVIPCELQTPGNFY